MHKGEKMAEQDQDTRQREKRVNQTEQHDESVLNPEIKDELDLSKKERRLIEKEKLKGMGMKKKLETSYLWSDHSNCTYLWRERFLRTVQDKNSHVHFSGKFNSK